MTPFHHQATLAYDRPVADNLTRKALVGSQLRTNSSLTGVHEMHGPVHPS